MRAVLLSDPEDRPFDRQNRRSMADPTIRRRLDGE